MKKLLLAMAIGAALAWFFDPDNGSGRRDALRKKLEGSGLMGSKAELPSSTSRSSFSGSEPLAATGVAPVATIP